MSNSPSAVKARKHRARLKELAATDANHPAVLGRKATAKKQQAKHTKRIQALRAEDYNHSELVERRAKGAKHNASRYKRNPEKQNQRSRENYERNREHYIALSAERTKRMQEIEKTNPNDPEAIKWRESLRNSCRKYQLANPDRVINHSPEAKERRRISRNIRCRLLQIFREYRNAGSNPKKYCRTMELLGCSLDEFKSYIESKFKEGMTWDNYSFTTWHLDHVIPMAAFNLNLEEDQKACCHYTNFQPLWAHENLRKSDKLPSHAEGPKQYLSSSA